MSARPRIRIVATGGTIAGTADRAGGYTAGVLGIEHLIAAVPALTDLAGITGDQLATIGSQDMDDATWLKLVHHLHELALNDEVDGIVVTHGTDTMEETAWFADLTLDPGKPVVFTGAMRPATAPDADGPANLLAAVATAADPQAQGRGVLVTMAGTIFTARAVTKAHTRNLGAFASTGHVDAGQIEGDRPVFAMDVAGPRRPARFDVESRTSLPRVDIVHAYAGMDRCLIDAAVGAGADGLVIAGMGSGNLPRQVIAALANLAARGIAVVRSTRVAFGTVTSGSEIDDTARGFVHANDLNPAKARVLLQLALLTTTGREPLQRIFDTH